jgi:MFS family permease
LVFGRGFEEESPGMAALAERRRYAAVMGMIGSGHALSHFYLLALPPLFPLLKAEFGVSYAALGLLVTMFNVATGLIQVPAGFLVDRMAARRVLIAGLVLSGLGIGLIGLAGEYWMILGLVVIAGLGNSVFHPADYAILNASVDPRRIGRAFALHTFAGNLGFTLAPATMILLSSLWGWRAALGLAGLAASAVVGVLLAYGHLLKDEASVSSGPPGGTALEPTMATGFRPLLVPGVLTMFAFFVCIAMVTAGLQSFSVTALIDLQGIALAPANTVLTAFLMASAGGVLLGGPIADRTTRHGLVAAAAMLGSAVLLLVVGGAQLPVLALIAVFAAIGLLQGSVRPSRDMMVRAVTPKGATGRVFAFVSAGLNLGAAATPVLFGLLIDMGRTQWVFYLLAAIPLLAIATLGVARTRRAPAAAPAE